MIHKDKTLEINTNAEMHNLIDNFVKMLSIYYIMAFFISILISYQRGTYLPETQKGTENMQGSKG